MDRETSLHWIVDEKGYLFTLSGPERPETLLDIPAFQLLSQLVDEEIGRPDGQDVFLPHTAVADLVDEDLQTLLLPDIFPFEIEINSAGTLADRDLHYTYQFLNGRTQPFVNPVRTGTYLGITEDQRYLITGDLYRLVESLDAFNRQPPETRSSKQNLLAFAHIKGLAREIGAILDTYLNAEEVVVPEKLGVRLRRGDGDTLEVEPILCKVETNEGGVDVVHPILDDEKTDIFVDIFDRLHTERDIYPIPEGPRVVLNEEQKAALHQFKKVRRVSGGQKEALIANPQAFFDPEVVYLDDFSSRVREIGEYRPRVFPFLRPQKEDWLPPEGGLLIDGILVYVQKEEAIELKARIKTARTIDQKEVMWKGQTIPATPEVIEALETVIKASDKSSENNVLPQIEQKGQAVEKKILLIKDNFDETDHLAGKSVRPGTPGELPEALLPDATLLPHQQEGVLWLQRLWVNGANGALLADDMGLGKTLQSLAFMAWVRELMDSGEFSPDKPMLIVAPVALLENWKAEYNTFSPTSLRRSFGTPRTRTAKV